MHGACPKYSYSHVDFLTAIPFYHKGASFRRNAIGSNNDHFLDVANNININAKFYVVWMVL